MVFKDIKDLKYKTEIMKNVFCSIRVVNPFTHEVAYSLKEEEADLSYLCYQFWGEHKECTNSISLYPYEKKCNHTKIEVNNNGIFVVTSIPIQISGQYHVLELIQNITENFSLEYTDTCKNPYKIMNSINKQIANLIITDELTGLYNRRFMKESLTKLLHNQKLLSVIYLDIDFFKDINDTYGHNTGDQVLKEISVVLQNNLQCVNGWIARYGGDEFVICLSDTDKEEAKNIAERIRGVIAEKTFIIEENKIHLTCSFGVNSVNPQDNLMSYTEFLSVADQKLYLAKSNGRNRVVC